MNQAVELAAAAFAEYRTLLPERITRCLEAIATEVGIDEKFTRENCPGDD